VDSEHLKAESCILSLVMPHGLALALETVTTALTVAGMGYFLASIVAARVYLRERRAGLAKFAPGVSVLKWTPSAAIAGRTTRASSNCCSGFHRWTTRLSRLWSS
jgi:hypothetical protein